MHLSDGNHSNFEISKISKIEIEIINESIEIFKQKLIKVKIEIITFWNSSRHLCE